MKIKAEMGHWSSVVGGGVLLTDRSIGRCPRPDPDGGTEMTDEELIARLREIQGQAGLFASKAADRIEALVKVRREDALELLAAHGQAQDAYEAQLKAEARAALEGEKPDKWQCPINYPGCKKNCGGYGCGN